MYTYWLLFISILTSFLFSNKNKQTFTDVHIGNHKVNKNIQI